MSVWRKYQVRGNETFNGHSIRCYQLSTKNYLAWDNYTVVYVDQPESAVNTFACVGLSGHGAAKIGRHLGKRIAFSDLPDALRAVVWADLA